MLLFENIYLRLRNVQLRFQIRILLLQNVLLRVRFALKAAFQVFKYLRYSLGFRRF